MQERLTLLAASWKFKNQISLFTVAVIKQRVVTALFQQNL